jgi:hypothetical protein
MEKSWLRLNCTGADNNGAFGISEMIGAKHSKMKYINSSAYYVFPKRVLSKFEERKEKYRSATSDISQENYTLVTNMRESTHGRISSIFLENA